MASILVYIYACRVSVYRESTAGRVGYSNHGESRDRGFRRAVCLGAGYLVVQGNVLSNRLCA